MENRNLYKQTFKSLQTPGFPVQAGLSTSHFILGKLVCVSIFHLINEAVLVTISGQRTLTACQGWG